MSKYIVTTESIVELQWNPEENLEELLKEFNETIFYKENIKDLEEWICGYLVRFPDTTFIEGIGKVAPEGGAFNPDSSDAVLVYSFGYESILVDDY